MLAITQFTRGIEAALQGISTADGYLTDLGASVHQGYFAQVLNVHDTVFPAAVIHPATEVITSVHGSGTKAILSCTVPIVVGVKANPGANAYEQVQQCVYDIRRALMLSRDALAQIGQGDTFEVSGAEPDVTRDLRLILAAMTASLSIMETY